MAEAILMPRLSDTMTEGVIAAWHKKVGDSVKRGELLAEIETDKATMELESYKDGTLLHIGTDKGGKLQVNDLLAVIGQPGEDISGILKGKASGDKAQGTSGKGQGPSDLPTGQAGELQAADKDLDEKVRKLIAEFDEFMNDDFSTAKVLANMFELAPVINSMKDKTIPVSALSGGTFALLQKQMKIFIEDIFGLKSITEADNEKLRGVMQLVIDIRKEARGKKDFATSDRIRNQLQQLGILLKDEKDGSISWSIE